MVTDWLSVSVWVVPYPSSQANRVPECGLWPAKAPITPAVAVHGALPFSKPALPSFWHGLPQDPAGLMVQLKVWLALACGLALSRTVAVTEEVPAVLGVPEMTPVDALMLRPGGSPVAEKVYGAVPPEAERLRLAATP